MGGCLSSNQEVNLANQLPKKDYWKESSSTHHASITISDELQFGDNLDQKGITVIKDGQTAHGVVQFTFHELAVATKNFCLQSFMGEGGFGCLYNGRLESTGQEVSVQHLHRNCDQGINEFFMEVLKLSLFHHANLVNLIGYCAHGDHFLLVHESMPLGSLEDHLHDLMPNQEPLDWNTRMKIAVGVAKGLEYLHDTANPHVVYRDLKPSNIFLDEGYNPKLSNFKLGKHGPFDNITSYPSFRANGSYTYCAPEGPLIFESDVYSFGLVFLELITGQKVIDYTRPPQEYHLVYWIRPRFFSSHLSVFGTFDDEDEEDIHVFCMEFFFHLFGWRTKICNFCPIHARPRLHDRRKYKEMADSLLKGRYPPERLDQALVVAAMCMQEGIAERPDISSVVAALTYLASQPYDPNAKT